MEALRLPPAVCTLLAVRGRYAVEEAKRFLRPRMDQLSDPALLADGLIAARRITRAIQDEERIFIHGDYDVDGVCATALLTQWVRSLGGFVTPFVPHRVRDGYDFSKSGLAAAEVAGASLLVTVDCGTVAHETIAEARGIGVDVIVTDHHTLGGELPDAFAVVNPQRPDCEYPDKGLCGTAVAFRLGELVGRELGVNLAELYEMLDLVALASTPSPPTPPPSPPPVPPLGGCTVTEAVHGRTSIDACLAWYYSKNLDQWGGWAAPWGNQTLGLCYWDHDLSMLYQVPIHQIGKCTTYACYCNVAPPPPPHPGTCGTDFCGCSSPDGVGGYAICPGECNCYGPPNRCMESWGSTCEYTGKQSGWCCTETATMPPPSPPHPPLAP